MKFSTPIIAAIAATYPAVEGYSLFGPSFFEPTLTFSPMIRHQRAMTNRFLDSSFKQLSPRYEIVNNEQQLQIAMDVPGVKMDDVDVSLEDGGKILTIRGSRRARTDESSFTSQFSQSFSLDPVIDVDNLTAHLVDGVLTVSAPKDMKRLEQNVKTIPILESAPPAFKLAAVAEEAAEETEVGESKTEEVEKEAAEAGKDDEVVDLDETKEDEKKENGEEL